MEHGRQGKYSTQFIEGLAARADHGATAWVRTKHKLLKLVALSEDLHGGHCAGIRGPLLGGQNLGGGEY